MNDLERPVGTYLYGRRMYEVMAVWETMADDAPGHARLRRDMARRRQDRVLVDAGRHPRHPRTRIERTFDADAIRELKASSDRDVTVGGPGLASQALAAGLVDELQLFATPVLVGGGTPAFPGGLHAELQLMDERRFDSGVVFLRYRVASG